MMKYSANERTKTRLLTLLKQHGALSAANLSSQLSISLTATRKHIQELQTQQLIVCQTERPEGRGRPRRVYRLSEQGEEAFPKTYADLCLEVLQHLEALYGKEAVDAVLRRRSEQQINELKDFLGEGNLQERAQQFCHHLSALNYDPILEEINGELHLIQRNCPHLHVAKRYQELCLCELGVYREIWGLDLKPLSLMTCGGLGCRYRLGFIATHTEGISQELPEEEQLPIAN